MKAIPPVLLSWLLLCSVVPLRGQVMTADGFEEGDFSRWRLQTWGEENRGTIAEPPVKFEGDKAFRAVANPKAAAAGRNWCEVGRYIGKTADPRWWGFAVLFPEDFRADGQNAVLCQMHSRPDKELSEQGVVPEVVLRLVGEQLLIEVRSDPGDLSNPGNWGRGGTITNECIYQGTIERGKWTTWVFHVKPDFSGDGFVQVWRDGEQVADYVGPLGMNNAPTKSIRIGLYKRFYKDLPSDAEQVVWFDAFAVGGPDSVFATVDPSPGGTRPSGARPNGYEGPLCGSPAPTESEAP